jgi:D-glycero-D-manno-heptose 1,7-bisphosphate phosphatase
VFLDRDGTVIEDRHYLDDPAGVRLLPGAAAAIARLNEVGLPVVLVSNQSGIGRGYFTEEAHRKVQRRLEALLAEAGASLSGAYHCPHAPDAQPPCDCRKPRPGLFERAARDLDLDLARSHYVGDRMRDLETGLRLGATTYLVAGHPEATARNAGRNTGDRGPIRVRSLADAVDHLLRHARGPRG